MTSDDSDPQTCENCNVAPSEQAKGHSYRLTNNGIQYDVEHLNDLGLVEEGNVRLLFNRWDNRLEFEYLNAVPLDELEALADEWEDFAEPAAWDEYSDGVRDATISCAQELRSIVEAYDE